MAAMIPECMVQNMAQPQRNPSQPPKDSRRKAYTPPLSGKVEASSAVTRAPMNVSAPATSHTRAAPLSDGTRPVTSDG